MSSNGLPWHVVKPRVIAEREAAVSALIAAAPENVLELQIRIRILDQFTAWFESPAPQERMMGDESAVPGY